jgi:predicted RNA methylase
MLTLAGVQPGDVVYDLGCGDGRVITSAARRFGATAVGIEVDPLRFLWCQLLITVLRLRKRVTVVFGDFFSHDLSEADVVTCYLLQDTNQRLAVKLLGELRPGARVVSNTFTFVGSDPVREHGQVRLYVFHPEPESPPA